MARHNKVREVVADRREERLDMHTGCTSENGAWAMQPASGWCRRGEGEREGHLGIDHNARMVAACTAAHARGVEEGTTAHELESVSRRQSGRVKTASP
jgi:hypothetical protein